MEWVLPTMGGPFLILAGLCSVAGAVKARRSRPHSGPRALTATVAVFTTIPAEAKKGTDPPTCADTIVVLISHRGPTSHDRAHLTRTSVAGPLTG